MLGRMWGEREHLFTVGGECKLVQSLWKTVWRLLKKLKIELSDDPAIPLLCMYLEKMKTLICKNTCIPIFLSSTIYKSQYMEVTQVSKNG